MKLEAKFEVVEIYSKVGANDVPSQVAVRLFTRKSDDDEWNEVAYDDPIIGKQPVMLTVGTTMNVAWEVGLS